MLPPLGRKVSKEGKLLELSLKCAIATWRILISQVENKNSPRGREMKLRKNQTISPKNFFSPTWRIKNSHVEIFKFPRGGAILLALLGDALLVGDEGCETAIGERVLEQTEDSLERAGGYVSTDAHTVDDVLGVTDASG